AGRKMKEIFDHLLVLKGCGCGVFFLGMNSKNIFRWHLDFRKQGFIDHPVITVRIVRWNVTLVAPEKIDLVPWNAGLGGQQRVQSLWGGTAGQSDGEPSVCPYRFGSLGNE